jgi:hypothetical protein
MAIGERNHITLERYLPVLIIAVAALARVRAARVLADAATLIFGLQDSIAKVHATS